MHAVRLANCQRLRASIAKIGKEEAIKDLHHIIKPLVAARPDVFGSAGYYSEDLYNRMGSLILSRSFHVEDAEDDSDDEEEGEQATANADHEADESNASLLQAAEGMDIHNENGHIEEGEDDSDEEDEDEMEQVKHIAMVPWADMLNARHGCDNARLFYEKDCLNMTTTKPIKKGEQIVSPKFDLLTGSALMPHHISGMYTEIHRIRIYCGGTAMLMTIIRPM